MKVKEKSELNKNFTKLTQKRGISLIVLIVTIIVIIILAAAVILTVGKNNPVESAREATFKEDLRSFQDDLALSISKDYTAKAGQRDNKFNADKYTTGGEADSVYTYIPSFTKKYEGKFAIVNDELKYVGEEEKEIVWSKDLGVKKYFVMPESWKATIADATEEGVPIPKGFKYVTGTKETGTVIEDSIGNQFVWIPATETNYVKDPSFPGATPTGDDTLLPKDITDEAADVKKYGGFYIGRYEAGIPTGDTSPSNTTGIPVSKQGATVWTNITYDNAKASAESMISNEYVQTGLLTGKAWDRTCHWIEDYITTLNANSSLTKSQYYGNYYNSTFKYINSSKEEVEKLVNSRVKIPAGSTEYTKTKNIYDLAGNVYEWTAEACSTDRLIRGGYYYGRGGENPVSYRNDDPPSNINAGIGFRSRLYIK